MVQNYDDFCARLVTAGFSMGGGNDEGVFSLIDHGWNEEPPGSPLRWHSGMADVDPWEWRIRVLTERSDIAYGKIFFKKSGFVTAEWYPYFLVARRGLSSFEDEYASGKISYAAKKIYDVVVGTSGLPVEEIKYRAGFESAEKSKFDTALTALQMRLYLTVQGQQPKIGKNGEEYGWPSTRFCTAEQFFRERGHDVFGAAAKISTTQAVETIFTQVQKLNPAANDKKIIKFIKG